ncbi:hypothetical protein BpHYR1_033592 [Brachionus plicatilis]|uniref:Uncharacterized protein n=1 Tax=Brachionus plicatilis TaxID=10195 RepID=A0A3M7P108_BRAPC|nr:hypothetical protein BpHYR1_033592 [Brachionus plicatilis]
MVFKYYLPVFVFYTRIIYSATGDSSADLRGVIVYFYKQTQAKFTAYNQNYGFRFTEIILALIYNRKELISKIN